MESSGAPARKRLLVLGAGPAQLGLLAAARERDLFVIAVDRNASAGGFRFADRRAVISVEDEARIERLAEAERIDGIIAPGIDRPVAVAARVAEKVRLPHPIDAVTAAVATSKVKQRERLAEAGVPQPRWETVTESRTSARTPAVVKPADSQGQKGVTLVRDGGDVAEAVELALSEARSRMALVEELVDGPEVTVNGFSVEGRFVPLTVTDRLTADPPAFGVALAHVWPSNAAAGEAVRVAEAAARALGITDGPTYTQLRIGADGPKVMEVAARLGGGHDAELCRAALGVDLNALAIAAALGEPHEVEEPRPQVGGAVTKFLVAPEGELLDVANAEEASQIEGVREIRLYRRPGHVFGPLRRGPDRAGAVLAVGDSREQALERAERAAALVRFNVRAASLV